MSCCSWNMKKNKLADIEMGEGDFGWGWTIFGWDLYSHNPTFLEGLVEEIVELEGLVEETTEIEGVVEEESDLEGLVGL